MAGRSAAPSAAWRAPMRFAKPSPPTPCNLFAADLMADAGWAEAAAGADMMLHIASPIPLAEPKNPDDLIVPARDGALRALRAARDAKVKRVVMTNSTAAICYGAERGNDKVFTEADWSNPDSPDS